LFLFDLRKNKNAPVSVFETGAPAFFICSAISIRRVERCWQSVSLVVVITTTTHCHRGASRDGSVHFFLMKNLKCH